MAEYIKDQCPVCQSNKFVVIGKSDLGDLNIKKPPISVVVKCKNCKTLYVNPIPVWSKGDFAILYSDDYFIPGENEIRLKRDDVKRRFDEIKKYIKSEGKNMLEFGAGGYTPIW